MTLSEYATYLAIPSTLYILLAGLDLVLPKSIKEKFGRSVQRALNACANPLGIHGYLFVVISSFVITVYIGLLTGVWANLFEEGQILSLPIKSAGTLIIGIILKITVVDYVLALKSYELLRITKNEHSRIRIEEHKAGSLKTLRITTIIFDLFISSVITNMLLSHMELSSLEKLIGPTQEIQKHIPPSISSFFNEVNLSIRYAIERSIFHLNGSVVFYFGIFLSFLAKSEGGIVDWDSVIKKPCTIVSFSLFGVLFIVFTSIVLAYR